MPHFFSPVVASHAINSPRLPPGPGIHAHDGADVPLSGLVFHRHTFVIHADVVGGHVEQAGLRRVGSRLLVLGADGRRTDVLAVAAGLSAFFGYPNRQAGFQVDARRPS